MMKATNTRRNAREWAIQLLTAEDINPSMDLDETIRTFWKTRPDQDLDTYEKPEYVQKSFRAFTEARVKGVLEHKTEIDEILSPLLKEWTLERLGTVERAVLRMGIWEMKYSDVPPPVVINEAIDLANWFSSPKSRSLINGVLDHYSKSRA